MADGRQGNIGSFEDIAKIPVRCISYILKLAVQEYM